MKKIQLYLLLGVVVFATGCPKYKPSVNFKDTQNFARQVNNHFTEKQKEYFAALANEPTKAKTIRNELIEDALPYIDDAYTNFITDIEAGRDRTNFIADVVELSGSSAIGIIKGPQRSIQIIGIALTAFRGGRRSADVNFFKEQTTPILISKMDGNRAKVRAIILTREKEEVDTYPIGAAISDIVAYYNAGTLIRAFTELAKDTDAQTNESERVVRVLRGDVEIRDIPTLEKQAQSDKIFAQRKSLTQQVQDQTAAGNAAGNAAALAISLPPVANPQNPTAAEIQATDEANRQRQAAFLAKKAESLKPIKLKLETIWREIQAQDKFAPAIEKMKANNRAAPILADLDAHPETVTESDYLSLINRLTAVIKDDTQLSDELLAILRKVNK